MINLHTASNHYVLCSLQKVSKQYPIDRFQKINIYPVKVTFYIG